jgi:hypothetical protein
MYYYRKNNKGSFRKLDVKSKKEAIKVLKALYFYKDCKDYEILSELEYNKSKNKKASNSNKIWKSLSDKSRYMCNEFLSKSINEKCCRDLITKKLVKQYDLENDYKKAYYAVVFNVYEGEFLDEGEFGLFCNLNELDALYYKLIYNHINDDGSIYMDVYDSITLKPQKFDFSIHINKVF